MSTLNREAFFDAEPAEVLAAINDEDLLAEWVRLQHATSYEWRTDGGDYPTTSLSFTSPLEGIPGPMAKLAGTSLAITDERRWRVAGDGAHADITVTARSKSIVATFTGVVTLSGESGGTRFRVHGAMHVSGVPRLLLGTVTPLVARTISDSIGDQEHLVNERLQELR